MFNNTKAFSGFSTNNLEKTREFYGQVLGLDIEDNAAGLTLKIAGSNGIFVYEKEDHVPATYTILNFPVDTIDEAVEALKAKGVVFEHYDDMTDEKGIARGKAAGRGPDIAWFKDPSGNILSILNE